MGWPDRSFQPCYSGCSSETHLWAGLFLLQYSFNPCYSGCSSETLYTGDTACLTACFNPCYSGCSSETKNRTNGRRAIYVVSILVILDVPLKRRAGWKCAISGFVSILVILDVPLKLDTGEEISRREYMFQSLLFWMFLWNAASPRTMATVITGFNPCYSGCSSETQLKYRHRHHRYVSILVILDVPLKPYCRALIFEITVSFNPCYSGCSSETPAQFSADHADLPGGPSLRDTAVLDPELLFCL